MPWCPQCKTEYQPGVTMCSDCNVELVESLDEAVAFIPFFQSEQKKVAEKLASFFEYSDLDSTIEYDEENDMYIVCIDPAMYKEAKKLYQAFYFVERERIEKGESDLFTPDDGSSEDGGASENEDDTDESDESGEASEDSVSGEGSEDTGDQDSAIEDSDEDDVLREHDSVYVMKADQYKDLTGTVWIFLIFGIAGLVFVLLNVLDVISFLNGWVPNTVMGALFLCFIYIALSTNQKAKKVQAEIDAENQLTEKINDWLKKNVTEDFLKSISDDTVSEELNYLRQTEIIRAMLTKEFGDQNPAYLDRLIEEYYNSTFDETQEE